MGQARRVVLLLGVMGQVSSAVLLLGEFGGHGGFSAIGGEGDGLLRPFCYSLVMWWAPGTFPIIGRPGRAPNTFPIMGAGGALCAFPTIGLGAGGPLFRFLASRCDQVRVPVLVVQMGVELGYGRVGVATMPCCSSLSGTRRLIESVCAAGSFSLRPGPRPHWLNLQDR